MDLLISIFSSLNPISAAFAILTGIIWGYVFRKFKINYYIIALAGAWYFPLFVSRILFVLSIGDFTIEYVGLLFLLLYIISGYLTRKIANHYNL